MKSSSKNHEIHYFNRELNNIETEKVYGDWLIQMLYATRVGRKAGKLFANKYISQIYGSYQDLRISSKKVRPFIDKFNISIDDYEPGSVHSLDQRDSYRTFNEFFIRKFKLGKRSFVPYSNQMPAFAEARYVGFDKVFPESTYPVKGHFLSPQDLLQSDEEAKVFEEGPLLIARLCPVDYHRFHYPDNGKIIKNYRIHGDFDSVNPTALKGKNDIFIKNERHVSILETENFGKLAYIEVGAVCVGKIVQSHRWDRPFLRGEEKGYFLFGGSTVVVLGEKGKWAPSSDILHQTQSGRETYLKLGDEVAITLN